MPTFCTKPQEKCYILVDVGIYCSLFIFSVNLPWKIFSLLIIINRFLLLTFFYEYAHRYTIVLKFSIDNFGKYNILDRYWFNFSLSLKAKHYCN